MKSDFPCTACGKCCQNVDKSPYTAYLNRGDGTCRHLDLKMNLCLIYEDRPLICQVEKFYQTYLTQSISWEDFVDANLTICHQLQQEHP